MSSLSQPSPRHQFPKPDYLAMYQDCYEQLCGATDVLHHLQDGIDKILQRYEGRVMQGVTLPLGSPDYSIEEIIRELSALRPKRVRKSMDAEVIEGTLKNQS